MKRIAFAVGLVLLVFAISIWAQAQAPKPYPELTKFDAFLGHWSSEGEYKDGPLGPGGKVTGERTVKRILGGFFIEFQSTAKGPKGESRSIWIVGFDPLEKKYLNNEYYDNGTVASGTYVIDGKTCTYSGMFSVGGNPYMLRMTGVFAADLMSYTVRGETSADGKTWIPYYEGRVVRIQPDAKTK